MILWTIPAFIIGYCIGFYFAQKTDSHIDDVSDLGDW